MIREVRPPHLLLHNLLGAMSYYGTTVRGLLYGFVLAIAMTLGVTSGGLSAGRSFETFVWMVGSFLLLDAGYVTIIRSRPFAVETADRALFLILLLGLATVIVWPYVGMITPGLLLGAKEVFLGVLFVLALRLILGLAFGHRVR